MKYFHLLPRFWKSILVLVIIFSLCLIPGQEISKIDFLKISYEDLVVHLVMFLGFSSVLFLDLQKNTELAARAATLSYSVLASCLLLGITTEVLQLMLKSLNRSGNIGDLLFDMIGAGLGISLMRIIRR